MKAKQKFDILLSVLNFTDLKKHVFVKFFSFTTNPK